MNMIRRVPVAWRDAADDFEKQKSGIVESIPPIKSLLS
jgi:hypothetical protein